MRAMLLRAQASIGEVGDRFNERRAHLQQEQNDARARALKALQDEHVQRVVFERWETGGRLWSVR